MPAADGKPSEWRFSGAWLMTGDRTAAQALLQTEAAHLPPRSVIKLVDAGITEWDSSLVAFIRNLAAFAHAAEVQVDVSGLPPGVQSLMALANAVPVAETAGHNPPSTWVEDLGTRTLICVENIGKSISFLWALCKSFGALVRGKARYRPQDLWMTVQECGPEALPIIALLSALVGMILAFLGAVQLKMFGAEIFIADVVAIGMAREMGGLMTGIILAGRTGAAFAARLGTMQVNEEIDALQTMGFSPMEFLVLPRALALILMTPLLTLYSMLFGMLGGAAVSILMFGITAQQYLHETIGILSTWSIMSGLIKSLVFGVIVAVSGCMQGIQCGRSAASVGEATTAAVVYSIIYIVVADSVISVLYVLLGL